MACGNRLLGHLTHKQKPILSIRSNFQHSRVCFSLVWVHISNKYWWQWYCHPKPYTLRTTRPGYRNYEVSLPHQLPTGGRGLWGEAHKERLNLSLAASVTLQDARYLVPVSILDENWQPLLPCASSFTHLHFTRKYVSQYYSRQGTLLNQEWSPFFNNKFLVRIIWTATPRIPCAGLNECDLVFKYFVFQTKYGRLQLKRINEDFSYEIGNLAGWGLICPQA